MGLPALLFTETWLPPALSTIDPEVVEGLRADYRVLLDQVRRDRPSEDTPEDDAALLRVAMLGLSTLRALGPAFVELQRSGINELLVALVRKEMETAEPNRSAALRYVEQAVHQYGVVAETYGAVVTAIDPSELETAMNELALYEGERLPMDAGERLVLRFQLDVIVALDALDAPLEELTFWAFRAITNARRVAALPVAAIPAGLRGEIARLRARRSWSKWDAAEMAKELAPWASSR